MYDNYELCSKCGGKCCKQMPGLFIPSDFKLITKDMLKTMVESGCYIFDGEWNYNVKTEQDELLYCIRPATKGESKLNIIVNLHPSSLFSYIGEDFECFYLTENGCELNTNERPHECKMLEPKEVNCKYHGVVNKLEIVKLWRNYSEMIKEIIKEKSEI